MFATTEYPLYFLAPMLIPCKNDIAQTSFSIVSQSVSDIFGIMKFETLSDENPAIAVDKFVSITCLIIIFLCSLKFDEPFSILVDPPNISISPDSLSDVVFVAVGSSFHIVALLAFKFFKLYPLLCTVPDLSVLDDVPNTALENSYASL